MAQSIAPTSTSPLPAAPTGTTNNVPAPVLPGSNPIGTTVPVGGNATPVGEAEQAQMLAMMIQQLRAVIIQIAQQRGIDVATLGLDGVSNAATGAAQPSAPAGVSGGGPQVTAGGYVTGAMPGSVNVGSSAWSQDWQLVDPAGNVLTTAAAGRI